VIALIFGGLRLGHRVEPTQVARIVSPARKVWSIACSPPTKACGVHGRVIAADGYLRLEASGLRRLPARKVYQAWIISPGVKKPIPEPTFAADRNGAGAVDMHAKFKKGTIVAVTIQPPGGSLQPPTTPSLSHTPQYSIS